MSYIYLPGNCRYENSEDIQESINCEFGFLIATGSFAVSEIKFICAIDDNAYFAVRRNGNTRLQKSKMEIRNAELFAKLTKFSISDIYLAENMGLVLTKCGYLFAFGNNNYNKLGAGNGDFADCINYDKEKILMFDYIEFWDNSGYLAAFDGSKLYVSGYSDIFQQGYADDNRKHVPYLPMCEFDGLQIDHLYMSNNNLVLCTKYGNKSLSYEKINDRIYENLCCRDYL